MQKSSPSCNFWVLWHLPWWLFSWNYSELFSVYWCKQRYCKTSPDKALEQCPLNPQKSTICISVWFFSRLLFAVNFTRHPLPLPRTWPPTQPWFFLFHRLPNIFWKRPSLAVSLWNILTHPTNPSSARHHPAALALCISFLSGICLLNPTNQQRIDAYCA